MVYRDGGMRLRGNMKKIAAILCAFMVISLSACSQPDIRTMDVHMAQKTELVRLGNEKLPEYDTQAWHEANEAKNYSVSVKGDRVYIGEAARPSDTKQLQVWNGYFTGIDYGEFGGGLDFTSVEGTYKLLDENVVDFIAVDKKYYVLTGLAHLGMDRGKMYRLDFMDYNGRWAAKEILDLQSCPLAYYLDNNNVIYMVTYDSLLHIRDEKISKVLVKDAFWRGLYPNSVLYLDGRLVIGMWGGVYTYQLSTGQQRWYPIRNK